FYLTVLLALLVPSLESFLAFYARLSAFRRDVTAQYITFCALEHICMHALHTGVSVVHGVLAGVGTGGVRQGWNEWAAERRVCIIYEVLLCGVFLSLLV